VREEWRVVDRWWTDQPVHRRYFDVVLESGENAVVFYDNVACDNVACNDIHGDGVHEDGVDRGSVQNGSAQNSSAQNSSEVGRWYSQRA